MLVLFAVIFFTLIIPIWREDLYGTLLRLRIVSIEEFLASAYIQKSGYFIMTVMILTGLSCCYGAFYLAERFRIGGFYRLLLSFTGILMAQFWIAPFPDAIVALNGVPAANYASHTVVTHLSNYSAIPPLNLLSFSMLFLNLGFACILTLLLWVFDHWRQMHTAKKQI